MKLFNFLLLIFFMYAVMVEISVSTRENRPRVCFNLLKKIESLVVVKLFMSDKVCQSCCRRAATVPKHPSSESRSSSQHTSRNAETSKWTVSINIYIDIYPNVFLFGNGIDESHDYSRIDGTSTFVSCLILLTSMCVCVCQLL